VRRGHFRNLLITTMWLKRCCYEDVGERRYVPRSVWCNMNERRYGPRSEWCNKRERSEASHSQSFSMKGSFSWGWTSVNRGPTTLCSAECESWGLKLWDMVALQSHGGRVRVLLESRGGRVNLVWESRGGRFRMVWESRGGRVRVVWESGEERVRVA